MSTASPICLLMAIVCITLLHPPFSPPQRPLRPLETIEDSFLSELQGLEINYEITDRQGRYLYDIDDNLLPTGPLEPEQAVLHERRRRLDGSMVTAPPSASLPSPRLARVGVTVVVTQDDGGDSLRNDDLQGGEGQEEVDDEDDDDGGVQHGNGGYYDFPMSAGSAQQEPVILSLNTSSNSVPSHRATHGAQLTTTRPSAVVTAASNGASGTTAATTTAVPDEQDTFSPSAGIFHTHTLPFNLPDNPNALNLQRRISSSSNNHHLNQTQSLIAPQVLAHDIHGIM